MDQLELTFGDARVYLCALVIFYGSILGPAIAYGPAQVQVRGPEALLLLIPMSAVLVIMPVARLVTIRSLRPVRDRPFIAVWGLAAIWLMWGLALPSAMRRLRSGR